MVNLGDGTVTKLRARDGANQGTFAVGKWPSHAAFDGATSGNQFFRQHVTKLRAADGALLGTFAAGGGPEASCSTRPTLDTNGSSTP